MNNDVWEVHADQQDRHDSPWSLRTRIAIFFWELCWALFCAWTPKPLNSWRLFWLRAFGARIGKGVFIHQRARILRPWNVVLHNNVGIGDRTALYSLGIIEIGSGSTVAQEAYICAGTHDFSKKEYPLMTAKITVGEEVFIGARAFVMPGLRIGDGAIVGACSVVTRDIPARSVCAGSPARKIKDRAQYGQ